MLHDGASEEWRSVRDTQYQVSSLGRVRSRGDRVLRESLSSGGYRRLSLRADNKNRSVCVHRLVAEAFLPNPEGRPEVDHLNRNRVDNRVANLRWVSHADNSANRAPSGKGPARKVEQRGLVKVGASVRSAAEGAGCHSNTIWKCCKSGGGLAAGWRWQYHPEDTAPAEEWKQSTHPGAGPDVEVSSLGRVRTPRGVTVGCKGSRYLTFRGNAVHRLVAREFCPRPENADTVDHLDNISTNNAASNLEWVTRSENTRRAIGMGLFEGRKRGRPVETTTPNLEP